MHAVGGYLTELGFEGVADFLRAWQPGVAASVAVPPAFAVDAVEIAYLAVSRQQVDAQ